MKRFTLFLFISFAISIYAQKPYEIANKTVWQHAGNDSVMTKLIGDSVAFKTSSSRTKYSFDKPIKIKGKTVATTNQLSDSIFQNKYLASYSGSSESGDNPFLFNGNNMPIRTVCSVGATLSNQFWLPAWSNRKYLTVKPTFDGSATELVVKKLPALNTVATITDSATFEFIPTSQTSGYWKKVTAVDLTNYVTTNTRQTITGSKSFSDSIKTNAIYSLNTGRPMLIADANNTDINNQDGSTLLHSDTTSTYIQDKNGYQVLLSDKNGTSFTNHWGANILEQDNFDKDTYLSYGGNTWFLHGSKNISSLMFNGIDRFYADNQMSHIVAPNGSDVVLVDNSGITLQDPVTLNPSFQAHDDEVDLYVPSTGANVLYANETSTSLRVNGKERIVADGGSTRLIAPNKTEVFIADNTNLTINHPTTGNNQYFVDSDGNTYIYKNGSDRLQIEDTIRALVPLKTTLTTAGVVTTNSRGVLSSSAVLPISMGGTGTTTKNFVDLSYAQTISGVKTFNNPVYLNSALLPVTPNFSSFGWADKSFANLFVNNISSGTALDLSLNGTNGTINLKASGAIKLLVTTDTITISAPLKTALNTAGVVTTNNRGVLSSSTALPISMGGTGATLKNFVDLTSNQRISGTKHFTDSTIVSNLYSAPDNIIYEKDGNNNQTFLEGLITRDYDGTVGYRGWNGNNLISQTYNGEARYRGYLSNALIDCNTTGNIYYGQSDTVLIDASKIGTTVKNTANTQKLLTGTATSSELYKYDGTGLLFSSPSSVGLYGYNGLAFSSNSTKNRFNFNNTSYFYYGSDSINFVKPIYPSKIVSHDNDSIKTNVIYSSDTNYPIIYAGGNETYLGHKNGTRFLNSDLENTSITTIDGKNFLSSDVYSTTLSNFNGFDAYKSTPTEVSVYWGDGVQTFYGSNTISSVQFNGYDRLFADNYQTRLNDINGNSILVSDTSAMHISRNLYDNIYLDRNVTSVNSPNGNSGVGFENNITELYRPVNGGPALTIVQDSIFPLLPIRSTEPILAPNLTKAYGMLYVTDGTATQSIPSGTTYTKLTLFTDTVSEGGYNITQSQADDQFTCKVAGLYNVTTRFAGTVTNSCTIYGALFRTRSSVATELNQTEGEYRYSSTSDFSSTPAGGQVYLAVGDILDFRIRHTNGSAITFTGTQLAISLELIRPY